MKAQQNTTLPVIPPGFKLLTDLANVEYSFLTFQHAYTWIGGWKPFMNGIGVREPIIVPDFDIHADLDDDCYVPVIPHKNPQADAEVYLDCQNSHVIGVTMMWVPVERLTEYGKALTDTFPMRVPVEPDTDDVSCCL